MYEKFLNISKDQRNANQKHNEISPHIFQDCYYYKKKKDNKYWKGCGVNETLHITGEVKNSAATMKTVW